MGLKSFEMGGREALEVACDGAAHRSDPRTAWFDCGSGFGNLALAIAAGWTERRSPKLMWLCPQCASRNTLKQGGSRNPADHTSADNGVALPDNE